MTSDIEVVLARDEAMRRIRQDHVALESQVGGLSDDEFVAAYQTRSGPLGDFCETLRDLVAHVLMWDEINLATLTEARSGRAHWSLDERWETRSAGQMLNRAGVMAGRELPPALLLHRLTVTRDALLDELAAYTEDAWTSSSAVPALGDSYGGLAQRVMTVPGQPAFWHAVLHLGLATDDIRGQ